MQQRQRQVIRGLSAAIAATVAAATSHSAADGGQPSLAGIVLALVFAAAVCIPLARTRMPLPRLTVAVTLSQLGFHLVFSYLCAGGSVVATSHHGGVDIMAGAASHHASPAMWALHACAAVATIWALRHGESVLSGIGRGLRNAVRFCQTAVPVLPRLSISNGVQTIARRVQLDSCGLRGPPPRILVDAQ